jgi:hypothetical protein
MGGVKRLGTPASKRYPLEEHDDGFREELNPSYGTSHSSQHATQTHSSCPDLIRASITLRVKLFEEDGLPGIGERKRRRPSDG